MDNNKMVDPQNVFFNSLLQSIKESYRCNSVKSISWKNPLLYKTTLCNHWLREMHCRFGNRCWYAHGHHELRFVPRLNQYPTAEYIHQYLSFLGLPKGTLDKMISEAYDNAGILHQDEPQTSWMMPQIPNFSTPHYVPRTTMSCNTSPIKEEAVSIATPRPRDVLKIAKNNRSLFQSSMTNNDWEGMKSVIGNVLDKSDGCVSTDFSKSFRMFGESYPLNSLK